MTAIVTPFDDQLLIDERAFVALMGYLADHGSDGLVVAGTTGEAATLTDTEQLALIELAVAERPAGMKIIAGTGSNDTRHAVYLTERASGLGVDGVLSVTPYYNRPNERGIVRHYEEVAARRTSRSCSTTSRRGPARTWGRSCSPGWPRSKGSSRSSRRTRRSCS